MTKIEMLLEYVIKPIVATGRTRLLVTLVTITALTVGIWKDLEHGVYYGVGIVFAMLLFIVSKTITDLKAGPANNGRCRESDPGNQETTPDPQ